MSDFAKCLRMLPDGSQCPEYAVHDGECEIHIEYDEMDHDVAKEIFNALSRDVKTLAPGPLANKVMGDYVGPLLERLAEREIGFRENNRDWANYRDLVKSWRRKLVQRVIDIRRERNNAQEEVGALEKARILDRVVIERQRIQLIAGARERAKLVAERAFAREAETRLRSDFGELADDLRGVEEKIIVPVGPVPPLSMASAIQTIVSWRATAEILADKELSDNLDEVRKAPIEDFGEVPRPEWRCHIHPNLEPNIRPNGDQYCSDGMCIQGQGD